MQQQFSGVKLTPLGLLALCLIAICLQTGCSEGPLWKMGRYSPWVQEKWAAEDRLVESVYAKREKLKSIASQGPSLDEVQAEKYALLLSDQLKIEQTLVLKVETIRTLGKIPSPAATDALARASKDPEIEVRIAAVQALKNRASAAECVEILREVATSDSNQDVRREALRSLGEFSGPDVIATLTQALDDRDPATQYRATESLKRVTGQRFGPNVAAWKNFLGESIETPATSVATGSEPELR